MRNLFNKDGRKFFSKSSNTIIFVVLVVIAYLVFDLNDESILINFLKYFTDILNIF